MAKAKNEYLMNEIKKYYVQGLSDGKIARILGTRVNVVHYYRYHVMQLAAHQTKRVYSDEETKLRGYILRGIKSSAKRRGLEFNLSIDDIVLVERCPLLGVELTYKNFMGKSDSNSQNFATVDRIDSSKGYVKGNIWIISRLANNMKSDSTAEQLKTFSENVLKNMI